MTPRLLFTILVSSALTWFLISWGVMGAAAVAAASEAVGASLGVLVLISVIGALRSRS